jgi:hypothetical protein
MRKKFAKGIGNSSIATRGGTLASSEVRRVRATCFDCTRIPVSISKCDRDVLLVVRNGRRPIALDANLPSANLH